MNNQYRVLIVDDEESWLDNARELVLSELPDGISLEIQCVQNFQDALRILRSGGCDLAVLDVREKRKEAFEADKSSGRTLYEEVKASRFVPVVFFTAYHEDVEELSTPPFIEIVPKTHPQKLAPAVQRILDSGAPLAARRLHESIDILVRDYMLSHVAKNWDKLDPAISGQDNLTHTLFRRAARTLDVKEQISTENHEAEIINASRLYLYPPIQVDLASGDVLRSRETVEQEWYVVLTPACDLAQRKVEYVHLARAVPLNAHPKFLQYSGNMSNGKWSSLWDVLRGNQARYRYLPAYLDIPELIIDLERIQSVEAISMEHAYERLASLDSPYAEELIVRYGHFRGRIGVPDFSQIGMKQHIDSLCDDGS